MLRNQGRQSHRFICFLRAKFYIVLRGMLFLYFHGIPRVHHSIDMFIKYWGGAAITF